MAIITDDFMRLMMTKTRNYSLVILKATSKGNEPGVGEIIWEHGRRCFSLRKDGVVSILCPVSDGSNLFAVGIFNVTVEETKKIMDEDPGVKAGAFVYEIHACRSFPGDSLPK